MDLNYIDAILHTCPFSSRGVRVQGPSPSLPAHVTRRQGSELGTTLIPIHLTSSLLIHDEAAPLLRLQQVVRREDVHDLRACPAWRRADYDL